MDPHQLFQQLIEDFDAGDDMMSSFFMSVSPSAGPAFVLNDSMPKLPPIYAILEISLFDIYNGSEKKVKVERTVFNKHHKLIKERVEYKVKIQPGWKAGTTFTYEYQGNQQSGHIPSDVIITIGEKEDSYYRRHGEDLVYKGEVELPLRQALCLQEFVVPWISGGRLRVCSQTDKGIDPNEPYVCKGQGLPKLKGKGKRGDLVFPRFRIIIPRLKKEQLKALLDILHHTEL